MCVCARARVCAGACALNLERRRPLNHRYCTIFMIRYTFVHTEDTDSYNINVVNLNALVAGASGHPPAIKII